MLSSFCVIIYALLIAITPTPSFCEIGPLVDGSYELAQAPKPEEYKAFVTAMNVREPYATLMRKIKMIDIGDLKNTSLRISLNILNFTKVIQFENGKEFDDIFLDGRPYKATFTVKGNQMTNLWKFPDGLVSSGVFTFTKDGFDQTCEVKGVSIKRTFKRVPRK